MILLRGQRNIFQGTDRFDACICVAGGWAGGNTLSPTLMDDAYKMIASSVYPSMISSHIAAAGYVKKNGLLLLPGAAPVLGGAGERAVPNSNIKVDMRVCFSR